MEHEIINSGGWIPELEQENKKEYGLPDWISDVENKVLHLEKRIIALQEQNLFNKSKELLKFKKTHENAITPIKANETDMCYDLFAVEDGKLSEMFIEYDTGIAFDIPEGYDIQVFPRSSISKYDLVLANSTGIIDNGYRDSIKCRFKIVIHNSQGLRDMFENEEPKLYKKGDRIAQFTLVKKVNYKLEEVDSLSESERGLGGFGSSGV